MTKPLIGVCGEFAQIDVYDSRLPAHFSLTNYSRSVEKAGGVPVILPITSDEHAIAVMADRVDGVLVTGGVDVDPSAYGQEPVPELDETQPERDAFEFALIRRLVDQQTPTLAVCRGIQSVAVALGGELLQHVDAVTILALPAAEQDQVVAGARKFRGQVPGRGGVVRGDDRIRPVRRDVVHEQGAELRLLVDDHDLDAHR